jgi:glucose-6-phosphate dehydrogenase assembly protein OpcA
METIADTKPSTDLTDLNRILKSLSEETKACLFNLIVYTQETRRTNYFKEVVKIIKSQFPCRIIFIQGNPSSKDNLLKVRSSTDKSQDEREIICDLIFIEAAGQDINKVYFLLFPLFVPDLPIYLFWGQDPTSEYTILPHLQYFATQLIFDSESTEDLQKFSRDMLNRLSSTSIQVMDMNWARIGGWRDVLAQIFDSQERFDQLKTSDVIQIIYNNRPSDLFFHPERQAIYLQAWLTSCLKWNFQKAEKNDDSQILHYSSEKASHQIHLTPASNPNFESEEILGITIKGQDFEGHFKRISSDQVEVQSSNQYECSLPFILFMPTLKSGRSFMQEIFYQTVSDQYVSMLKTISSVNWS